MESASGWETEALATVMRNSAKATHWKIHGVRKVDRVASLDTCPPSACCDAAICAFLSHFERIFGELLAAGGGHAGIRIDVQIATEIQILSGTEERQGADQCQSNTFDLLEGGVRYHESSEGRTLVLTFLLDSFLMPMRT